MHTYIHHKYTLEKKVGLEKQLSGYERFLLLQKTQLPFPASASGGSQPPIATALRAWTSYSGLLCQYVAHTQTLIYMLDQFLEIWTFLNMSMNVDTDSVSRLAVLA